MLKKLKEKITGFSKCAGVEAILLGDAVCYNFILLEKKGSLISVLEKKENLSDINELKALIPKDTPVALAVNGRGILHRKLKEEGDEAYLLSQILPDAKVQDFYIQKYISGSQLFASVIRKATADTVFKEFLDSGIAVINLSLGPFSVGSILPFMQTTEDTFKLGTYSLTVQAGLLTEFVSNPNPEAENYKIGEEELAGTYLIAYSSAVQLFFPAEVRTKVESAVIQHYSSELLAKKKFQLMGKGMLAFFFLIALLNYLLYSHLREDNSLLTESSNRYQQTLTEVTNLQKKIEEKEYFLKRAGWLSFPKASFYSDEIASTVPASVKLTALIVNPLNEKLSKKEKKQHFQSDTILVSGVCSSPVVLNPWMNELKSKDWIKGLTTVDYSFDHKKRTGSFELEIWIRNEF